MRKLHHPKKTRANAKERRPVSKSLRFEALEDRSLMSVFSVVNVNDSGPGSLRQAMLDANSHLGPDKIHFNIGGCGSLMISPRSALPAITSPVIIDGYTQPGASPGTDSLALATASSGLNMHPLIELDGTNAGNTDGLVISSDNSVIRGLIINHFSGNAGSGVVIYGNNNRVQGNLIGVDISGTQAESNSRFGIFISAAASENLIGGAGPGEGNVIAGNGEDGIFLTGHDNRVQGNLVGVDLTGKIALKNGLRGVEVSGSNNLIGGDAPGAGNLISGNDQEGISLYGQTNMVLGNFIGTDVTGTQALGNRDGISVSSASGNRIGDTSESSRNLISGNRELGVFLVGNGTTVQGNVIGTDLTGGIDLGNKLAGVYLRGSQNVVGGQTSGAGNVIAFNGSGVLAESSSGSNAILDNAIYANVALGIDLGYNGVTLNDAGDSDEGANGDQNFPLLLSATTDNAQLTVRGTLNSTPGGTYRVEFFTDDELDPSGYGEGRTFLGAAEVTTDADGNAIFSATLPPVPAGSFITGTATDLATNNTSEFSAGVRVNRSPMANNDYFQATAGGLLTSAAPGVLANDSYTDVLHVVLFAPPLHGTLTLDDDGSFTYSPNTGFTGTDSFLYGIRDAQAESPLAAVTIDVVPPPNHAPSAADDRYLGHENMPLAVANAAGVLANDSDSDSDPLTAIVVSQPQHGTLTLAADGSFVYTPDAGFHGVDGFTYAASDRTIQSDAANVEIDVAQTTHALVAVDDFYAAIANQTLVKNSGGVLANDQFTDGDAPTTVLVNGPTHGTLTFKPDGTFTYQPQAGFAGYDYFEYKAIDGQLESEVATVRVEVIGPVATLQATNDLYNDDADVSLQVSAQDGVLRNDVGPDGAILTAVLFSGPQHGKVVLSADGSFTYTPNSNFSGVDGFLYRVYDGNSYSLFTAVTIRVKTHVAAEAEASAPSTSTTTLSDYVSAVDAIFSEGTF
jgi:VCBS repeat-containing protein